MEDVQLTPEAKMADTVAHNDSEENEKHHNQRENPGARNLLLQNAALRRNFEHGSILSAHKQLVAKKLEEAEEGRKKRSEKKKEKHALRVKGHSVPASYVNAKEKELIKLATRGVVKLFNAVSKVQSCDVGAKMTKSSDAKELVKQNKSTFLSMLQGANGSSFEEQRQPLDNDKETTPQKPGWSALQDSFMLGKARLKDWDKKQDDDAGLDTTGDSSDDSDWK